MCCSMIQGLVLTVVGRMMKAKRDSNEILQMVPLDEYHHMKYNCLWVVKLHKSIEFEGAWNMAKRASYDGDLEHFGG